MAQESAYVADGPARGAEHRAEVRHTSSAPAAATLQLNSRTSRIPKGRITFFKGGAHFDPGEYKEWRREVAAIKRSSKIEDKDFAGVVFLATMGDARNVLWNIDPANFSNNGQCLSDVMEMLNKEFDRPGWEEADHAAGQFEKCAF